jgi:hypothetical protein
MLPVVKTCMALLAKFGKMWSLKYFRIRRRYHWKIRLLMYFRTWRRSWRRLRACQVVIVASDMLFYRRDRFTPHRTIGVRTPVAFSVLWSSRVALRFLRPMAFVMDRVDDLGGDALSRVWNLGPYNFIRFPPIGSGNLLGLVQALLSLVWVCVTSHAASRMYLSLWLPR